MHRSPLRGKRRFACCRRLKGTAMKASSAVPAREMPRRTIESASHDALRIISSGWKRIAEVTSHFSRRRSRRSRG